MNLHILFCPTQTIGADGGLLPIAALALTLDDEVQYRCAGYIQAEIERYAEEIADGTPVTDDNGSDDGISSNDEAHNAGERHKNGKGKAVEKNGVTSKKPLPAVGLFN
jgi:cohesin complex subunit SA-1/2